MHRSKTMFISNDMEHNDDGSKMVAAIELGTSYSGYAYCKYKKGKNIAGQIIMNPMWVRWDKSTTTMRTPTCVLLNETREFEAFGYDAEKKYLQILKEGKHNRWFFFRRFRNKIYVKDDLNQKCVLKDESGKLMSALKVFSTSLRYLKSHLLHDMCIRSLPAEPNEIRWVITVPAFWGDLPKQFIRKAAIQAGIPADKIILALEPEAASLMYQNMSNNNSCKTSGKTPVAPPVGRYMLADLGGGKTDIIVQEKNKEGLKELCLGKGHTVGGGAVDAVFIQFLNRMLGDDIPREFFENHKVESRALMREFDIAKRRVTPRSSSFIELNIPVCIDTLCKRVRFLDGVAGCVKESLYKDRVTVNDGKMRIDAVVSNEFFRATSIEILKLIKAVLSLNSAKSVYTLVVSGGLSQSLVVQEIFRQELVEAKTNIRDIIYLPDSETTVLRGAVMYGNNPEAILSRVNRYTVGMRIARLYNPEIHPPKRKIVLHGVEYIGDVFAVFLTRGTRVPSGFMAHQSLTTTEPMQKKIEIDIFSSEEVGHNYVNDEGSSRLGKVVHIITKPSESRKTMYVDIEFGGTELVMYVTDNKTGDRSKYYLPSIDEK